MPARPYQQECLNIIDKLNPGSYIVNMATGLGKTYVYTHIKRHGRVLVLAHREELINQPIKYYDFPVGVEMASQSSHGEEVVIASVQSLTRRLSRFDPDEFDMIVTDECHHSAARTYRAIYNHFNTRIHIGLSATVNRGDKVRLDDIFSDIIFQRDLRWGIENNYLSDIYCRRVNIGYDLSHVRTSRGDYAPGELEEAMDGTADAIAQTYRELAEGATLIFAVSVNQAQEIAKRIPGSAVVTGETKDRARIIEAFTAGEIPCIVNVMVFTEGTDIPRVETIIIARPTQSDSLYTQMVGRGLRLYPGKERLNLIDCVGVTGKASLCTAPSLLGIDMDSVPARKAEEVQGMLFELPVKAAAASDVPESWVKNVEIVNLWAMEQKYQTHDVSWFKMPSGDLVCSLPDRQSISIPCPNELGRTEFGGRAITMQAALDEAYRVLESQYQEARYIWDLNQAKRWGRAPASEKQLAIIRKRCKGFDCSSLTKGEASMILNRIMAGRRKAS